MDLETPTINSQAPTRQLPLILAVDDDEDSLLVMAQAVELFGFSCISALDGKTALQIAETREVSLLLLDVVLPGVSGVDVVRRLRQNPEKMAMPIIAVTAMAATEDRAKLLEAGCTDYLSKPYNLDDLEAVIRQHLSLTPLLSCAV